MKSYQEITEAKVKDTRKENGWYEAIIDGRWVKGKIFDDTSSYGIPGARRISKLIISKNSEKTTGSYPAEVDYSFDRGLDVNEIDRKVLKSILKKLSALPKVFSN